MNVAQKLAALEELLERVRRNAAERRGVEGEALPRLAQEPRDDEPRRPAPVVRKSERPMAEPARLERLLDRTWDTWGDGAEARPPETLTALLGQPVRRGPRVVAPADAEPASPAATVAASPARAEPELVARSILAPELEEALARAASEPLVPTVASSEPPPPVATVPPAPPASIAPPPSSAPPASTEPPGSANPDSLGRSLAPRRRVRSRRWFFLPRAASRRSTPGIAWRQLGLALAVALPVVGGVVYLLRRESPPVDAPPERDAHLDAASARVALQPARVDGGTRAPIPDGAPPAVPASEAAALGPDRGYVVVKTAEPARAYFNGVLAGETNQPLEVACGWRNLRLARPAMPGPGESYPIWVGEGRPVLVACRGSTTLDMAPR